MTLFYGAFTPVFDFARKNVIAPKTGKEVTQGNSYRNIVVPLCDTDTLPAAVVGVIY